METIISGILGALTSTAVGTLITWMRRRRLHWRNALLVFVVALTFIVASDFTPVRLGETIRVVIFGPPSLNERWTRDAWREFERHEYESAIVEAQKVLAEYAFIAEEEQKELDHRNAPVPAVGRLAPFRAMKVFESGVVNDVGTCYWLIGRSLEAQGKTADAMTAYAAASKLTRARAWDSQKWPLRGWSPLGSFWSPSMAAKSRAAYLASR